MFIFMASCDIAMIGRRRRAGWICVGDATDGGNASPTASRIAAISCCWVDDDFLRQPAELFVAAVAKHGLRHVDRALMMRHHHRDEIAVDIAGRLDRHVRHHLVHGGVIVRQERLLGGKVRPLRGILDRYRSVYVIGVRRILRQGERRRCDRCRGRQRDHPLANEAPRKQNHLPASRHHQPPCARVIPRPAFPVSPISSWMVAQQAPRHRGRRRVLVEHGGGPLCSQLKTNLGF